MKFEIYEYTIPTYAIVALEYSDLSGLGDKDIEELDAFLETLPGSGHWDFDGEPYFHWRNDISDLGGDVIDARYLVPQQ